MRELKLSIVDFPANERWNEQQTKNVVALHWSDKSHLNWILILNRDGTFAQINKQF